MSERRVPPAYRQNFPELSASLTAIEAPWQVEMVKKEENTGILRIYIRGKKTQSYPCPLCKAQCLRLDDEDQERVWRDEDANGMQVFLHCRRPRVGCERCGVHVVNAPWARKSSRYTLAFEKNCLRLLKTNSISKVSRLLGVSRVAVSHINAHWRGQEETEGEKRI